MIFNTIILLLVSYLAYRVYLLIHLYTEYLRYKKQGVPFADKNGFSFVRDANAIRLESLKHPTAMPWTEIQQELFGVSELPPVTGLIFLGGVIALSINTYDWLEDIYVNQNRLHTKAEHGRAQFSIMAKESLNFQETHHPHYGQKRKAIGAALFKQKLLGMAPTMKRVALDEVKRW
jgi:hypothetical protein